MKSHWQEVAVAESPNHETQKQVLEQQEDKDQALVENDDKAPSRTKGPVE